MSPYQAVDECFFAFFFSAEILDLLRPKKLRNTYILVYILLLVCMNVFFSHIDVFFSSGSGYFSCSRLRGTQGARPNTTAQVWALAEVRGTCSGVSKSQVTTGRHSEHVEPSRPMQTHVQVKKCPTADVISKILNLVNVVRHYLVIGDGKVFPRHQLARHATTFSTIRYNLHDLGRIVYSQVVS